MRHKNSQEPCNVNKEDVKIAIIGAGLTGLTTAFYLKKNGVKFHVFEKDNRPGGVIRTNQEDGFIFESGPNTGALGQPEAAELFEDLKDDCTLEVANEAAKARWIWLNGKWEAIPSGLIGGIATPLFTFGDKLRILGEPFRKPGTNPDETVAEMVRRRMGKSFLRNAVDPFLSGVYAGDPEKLITRFALPKLYNLEHKYGSFIGGTIKKAKEPKTEREKKATKAVFSAEGGLENLVKALVKNIGDENISLSCKNLEVKKLDDNNSYQLGEETFTHVISTVGAYGLQHLFPFLPAEKVGEINQMKYAKVTQVSLGFKNWKGLPIKSFGGLVPSAEKRQVLGILFLSSFLKYRAPEGGAMLSVFMGGIRKPELFELNDEELLKIVEQEVTEMMGLQTFDPDICRIFRYEHAIPQYSFESEQKLAAISALEKEFPGVILAGNIRDGIGMADRIKQGRIIADHFSTI
ncbi:protoporphyrinogen oxidase [Maribellus sp. YY47]|uniref:protoporphyrinogen oxidase n=1 Tax=Maribellus sp. YY47 TaxID=2929486 RepID=UPI002001B714|nr:protoporphyrinogen oxidase [Maribellus sp. YY47]MCK3686105.1 protoporphyrinogen oxidase [Maribellus sp. YY47]